MKYKIGQRVTLKRGEEIDEYSEFADEWVKFWEQNQRNVLTIYDIVGESVIGRGKKYTLSYVSGRTVKNPVDTSINGIFYSDELDLYVQQIMLPEELFKL